ncbi:hypothetical protein [Ketobacter alkanivorans]|uniref:Uncharacterized protein n=1 Tax=Ketobacter alkanivorans TaxID=1917421 RepID=A0A2K9LRZ8_9GAMM|nr:hypothetical protein [Ketobacter alkanivorans]AUM14235.1 hypothetical protein Kalk_18190 [Ketobacter alkanivorans]MCP5018784.1 hypothetical protein [Ketobacter sp.]
MAYTLLTIIATALLSSLLTLGIAHFIFQKRLKHHYDAGVSEAIERFKAEVGPEIEARVKQGVLEGFKSLPSKEMLRDTTRTIAKTGLDLMGDSLKMATRPARTRGTGRRPGGTPLDDD